MMWPFWRFATFVAVCELVAVGATVWSLCRHWDDAWYWFALYAFNLAALCGAATAAIWGVLRAYKLDKEWKESVE